MADNVTADSGSGGATFFTDDIGGTHAPLTKIMLGALDSNDGPVASGNPMPVTGTITAITSVTNDVGVVGAAAENAAASGNPVLTGGRYDATPRTLGDGDVGAIALAADGAIHIDDGGNTITVDGTVTANLSATDNSVLDTIETNTDFGTVTGGGAEASALRVTIANDSTGVVSVDNGGGALTVDGTVTANLSATDNAVLDSIDSAVNGTLTVDLGANNDVTIDNSSIVATEDAAPGGNVSGVPPLALRDDSLSALTPVEGDFVPLRVNSTGALHVTGGGGGTQYAVDDAAGGTDTGTLLLAVRDDSLTTLTPADGDYTQLRVSSTGALHVTGGGGGGTEYNEDVATPGTITGTATMMERDDALSTLTPIEGDWAAMRCSAEGALWVQEANSDAILADTANMDTNLGTIAGAVSGSEMQVDIVSGTVTANLSATDNAVLDTIETNTDFGTVTGGGTETGALRVTIANDSTGVVSVDDGGGALTVDGTVTANLSATDNAVLDNIDTNTSAPTSHYRNIDANAEDAIKGSAGILYWVHVMNLTSSVAYLHLYDDTTSNVTPGTTTPDFTFPIPTQGDTNGAGFMIPFPNGHSFTNAITLVCTTTTDGSTGDPGTNGVMVNAGYE